MEFGEYMQNYGSFIALLNDRALNFPNRDIFYYMDDGINVSDKLTYQQLLNDCHKISYKIKQHKKNNDKVVLLVPQNLDFIRSFLGVIYAGCIPVTAYPPKNNRNLHRIVNIIEDSEAEIILTLSKIKNEMLLNSTFKDILKNKKIICIDEDFENSILDRSPIYNDAMFIQYTSGSTGNPKGVVITHGNVLNNMEMIKVGMNLDEKSSFYSWLPFFHDMGLIGCILTPIYVNCPSYLTSPSVFIRNPKVWLQGISKFKNTITGAPNFAFDYLIKKIPDENEDIDLSSLKVFFNGAEPIRRSTLFRFADKFSRKGLDQNAIFPCYGMAEATLYVSGSHFNFSRAENPSKYSSSAVNCGIIAKNMDVIVFDQLSGKKIENGAEGEIAISGGNVTDGYLRSKDKDRFVESNGKVYFKTGDLGFLINSDLYVTGRIKDLIILNGMNYHPDDLEKELTDNINELGIGSCAAIGIQDGEAEKLVIISEVERSSLKKDLNSLALKIVSTLNKSFEISPHQIYLLKPGAILKTSSGKLQRQELKKILSADKLEYAYKWSALIGGSQDAASSEATAPNGLQLEKSSHDILKWIDLYFEKRIDILALNEKRTITPNIILDFASYGIMGMIVPKEYGGPGLPLKDIFEIVERIATKDISLALFVGLNNILGIYPIIKFAKEEVKLSVLPKMASGIALGAFAITEMSAGSNPRGIEAAAKKKNKKWILNGKKTWVGSAAWSKYINTYFKDYDENGHYVGISGFLINTEDMSVIFGPEELTMGVRPMIQSSVIFNNTEVEEKFLLAERGLGLESSYKTMRLARIGLVSIAIGALSKCLDIAKSYASERLINTGIHSENGFTIVEMLKMEYRLSVLKSFRDIVVHNANESEIAEIYSLVSKIIAPEFLWTSVDRSVQILGARGYIENNVLPAMLRDSRLLRIFEGPTETLEYHLGSIFLSEGWEENKFLGSVSVLKEKINKILSEFQVPLELKSLKENHVVKIFIGRLISYEILRETVKNEVSSDSLLFLKQEIEKIKNNFQFNLEILKNEPTVKKDNRQHSSKSRGTHKEDLAQFKKDKDKEGVNLSSINTDKKNLCDIRDIFLEVSGGRVKIKDDGENILNYGLDSVMAIEASMRIEEVFDVTFPEHILWDVNTVEKILSHIKESKENK